MKQLFVGIFLGAVGSLLVVWLSTPRSEQVSAKAIEAAQVAPEIAAAPVAAAVSAPPKSKETSVAATPTPSEMAQAHAPAAPRPVTESPVPSAAPVPPLFSGNVEGFPKLDEKTKKVLDRVQQKVAANQPEAALEDLEAAYRAEPQNAYYAVELAMMNNDLFRNTRRTEEVLTEYLRKDPNSKMVSAAYADYLSQQGREKEAGSYYATAASGPDAPLEARTQQGHHFMRESQFGKAAEVYRGVYEDAARDLQDKVTKGETPVFAKQRLGFAALDSALALLHSGDSVQARQMAGEAVQILGADHPQVRKFYETERALPKGQKSLSE